VPALLALGGTFTRSAWLGLVGSLAVLLGFWRPRWLPALALVVALIVAVAPGSYRARLVSVFDPNNLWNRERVFMWDAGVRMFHDHPITGVGLMDLHAIYDRYRSPASTERAGHLHSVPVMIAATMGWVGIVAFAGLMTALFWTAAAGLPGTLARGGLAAGVRLGVLAALVGFVISGLFEWNLGDEELLYPLYVLAGLAWAARTWRVPDDAPAAPAPPRPAQLA
jgi:O-antigen ligase